MNQLLKIDCMEYMRTWGGERPRLILTDIPYGEVNRKDSFKGLRGFNLNRGVADVATFDLMEFCRTLYDISDGVIIIFCGQRQFSSVFGFFADLQAKHKGSVRQLIWEKTNPSPMNGDKIYLTGIENAVWFKKSGTPFFGRYKNTVFHYPMTANKIHPTEKHHGLLKELILDNSSIGDLVFDPCAGSGSTLLVSQACGRRYVGCELNQQYFDAANERLKNANHTGWQQELL